MAISPLNITNSPASPFRPNNDRARNPETASHTRFAHLMGARHEPPVRSEARAHQLECCPGTDGSRRNSAKQYEANTSTRIPVLTSMPVESRPEPPLVESTDAEAPPYMLPMQSSWTPPPQETLNASASHPLHPVYKVPMVSEQTLNRYLHPLQAIGVVGAEPALSAGAQAGVATTVYRVSPDGGLQDLVTSDGFRHRFDVEVVYPSAATRTWGGRDALQIHPEVEEFAISGLTENLRAAGIGPEVASVSAFRMHGGTPNTPWFMDELIVKTGDGRELMISLNVAMRDPQCAVGAVAKFLAMPGDGSVPS